MGSAVESLRAELARNPAQAAQRFEKLTYCWNEITLLPFVEEELAPHAQFHNAIAGWINLTYSDVDRERLRPLAERIGKDGQLEPWAQRLLQERGYVPELRKDTWAETVRIANLRL